LFSNLDWSDPTTFEEGTVVRTVAIVSEIKPLVDKKNRPMAFLTLEDRYNTFEGVVFSNVYEKYLPRLNKGEMLFLIGKASSPTEDSFKLLCDEIMSLEEARSKLAGAIRITIDTKSVSPEQVDALYTLVRDNPGLVPLIFDVRTNGNGEGILMQSQKFQVLLTDDFIRKMQQIVGKDSIIIRN